MKHPSREICGFADDVSVLPGARVHLYVSTEARSFTVAAYRMGWYAGVLGRRLWVSGPLRGRRQPGPRFLPATRTDTASSWRPSLSVDTAGWVPGDYLFVLTGARVGQAWIPLTVRTRTTVGAVVILNAVTTWQAYNDWGGHSLYTGPDGAYATQAYAVSFDRPYATGFGAADFAGNELPLLARAERLGLPLANATDVDLDADPRLLDGARAVISLGHDEYWSAAMRTAVTEARDRGVNIAFLGANAVYRHIRLQASPLGARRLEIDYKTHADADRSIAPTHPRQHSTGRPARTRGRKAP